MAAFSRFLSKGFSLLCVVFFLLSFSAEAGLYSAKTDSLQHLAENCTSDCASLYNELSETYLLSSPERAYLNAEKALVDAQAASDKEQEVYALNNIGLSWFYRSNYEKTISYFNNALELARKNKLEKGEAISYNNIGLYHMNFADYELAIDALTNAVNKAISIKDNYWISEGYNNLGRVYYNKGEFKTAINTYKESERYALISNNDYQLASVYNNIGLIYDNLGAYETVLKYYEKALVHAEQLDDKFILSTLRINLGIVFSNLGDQSNAISYYNQALEELGETGEKRILASLYLNMGAAYNKKHEYSAAIEYYNKSLQIFESLGSRKGIANCLNWIGILYREIGDLKSSEEYLLKALQMHSEIDNVQGIISAKLNLGNVYSRIGELQKAESFVREALLQANDINHREYVRDSYALLAEFAQQNQDYKKALEYTALYNSAKDSIFNEAKSHKIAELEIKYEVEKQQQELELLKQLNENQELEIRKNNYFLFGMISLLGAGIVIVFLIFRHSRLIIRQKNIVLEQKLLRAQMNPHFIFNSLTAIQNFIYKSNQKEAGNFLSRFAKLVRLILENSREEYITLEKELQTLHYYLELQQLRFAGKIEYFINVDETIDTDSIMVPPMLTQPFIENAIEHGILPLQGTGDIRIDLQKGDGCIIFRVEDNGIGREQASRIRKADTHKSLATTITSERLQLLNRNKGRKIRLSIEDLKDESDQASGTRITFEIPLKYK